MIDRFIIAVVLAGVSLPVGVVEPFLRVYALGRVPVSCTIGGVLTYLVLRFGVADAREWVAIADLLE